MRRYYFTVNNSGEALVLVTSHDESGLEKGWSMHSSEDASLADGDGSLCPYPWKDACRWDETTREHASSLLKFELPQ